MTQKQFWDWLQFISMNSEGMPPNHFFLPYQKAKCLHWPVGLAMLAGLVPA
jgi:hypothetical protein